MYRNSERTHILQYFGVSRKVPSFYSELQSLQNKEHSKVVSAS